MRPIDEYHRAVRASGEDHLCIGTRPDPIAGVPGDGSETVCPKLGDVVRQVIDHFQRMGARNALAAEAADDETQLDPLPVGEDL
jgi:hypothetical protein